jgi:hypothetical protein
MKNYYLYRHIRLDTNEPFYIGIGTSSLKANCYSRKYARAYSKTRRSNFWYSIINKSGYKVDILFESTSLVEIKLKETEFIKLYGRRNLGLGTLINLTDGGELNDNIIVSEAKKEKLRLANKGLKHPKWRNEIKSKAQGGENHWTRKKKFSEEAKINMSEAQKKLYKKGYISPRLGKSNSKESIQKTINKISIPILQFNLLGEFIKEWKSASQTKEFGFNPTNISQCCKNKRKTHKKFIWKYKKKNKE